MKQKWMAAIINRLPQRWLTYFSKRVVNSFLNKYATIQCEGMENLQGIKLPTLFVCNHLSNSDGLVLNRVLKEIDPTFVAGVKLKGNALTKIGVNVMKTTSIVPDSPDKEGITKIIQLMRNGESMLIFPEGTRSRVGSMIEAKKGILLIAKLTGAPIVPIGLSGTEKLLPINANGDMGAEKFQHAKVCVRIGKQFELPKREKHQDKETYEAMTMDMVMHQIAELIPEEYRGVYS